MSQEELQRIKVIENTVAGRITVREAAEYLNLSERQIKRLKQTHDAEDVNWVYHGNRGRAPANALDAETRQQGLHLAPDGAHEIDPQNRDNIIAKVGRTPRLRGTPGPAARSYR